MNCVFELGAIEACWTGNKKRPLHKRIHVNAYAKVLLPIARCPPPGLKNQAVVLTAVLHYSLLLVELVYQSASSLSR